QYLIGLDGRRTARLALHITLKERVLRSLLPIRLQPFTERATMFCTSGTTGMLAASPVTAVPPSSNSTGHPAGPVRTFSASLMDAASGIRSDPNQPAMG